MSYSLSWNVLPSDVMWEKSYISVYNIFWRCIWSFWNWQMRHEEIKMRTVNVTGSCMVSCKKKKNVFKSFTRTLGTVFKESIQNEGLYSMKNMDFISWFYKLWFSRWDSWSIARGSMIFKFYYSGGKKTKTFWSQKITNNIVHI